MRLFAALLLAASAVVLTVPPVMAQSQPIPLVTAEKPLMIIRFNQRTVYYSKALYMAVSRAVDTKTDVQFTLTSLIPQTGDRTRDKRASELAELHTRQVLREMQGMGVPAGRVNVTQEFSSVLDYDEVHIRAY